MSKDERIRFLCEQLRTKYKQWFNLTDVVKDLKIPKSSAHRRRVLESPMAALNSCQDHHQMLHLAWVPNLNLRLLTSCVPGMPRLKKTRREDTLRASYRPILFEGRKTGNARDEYFEKTHMYKVVEVPV